MAALNDLGHGLGSLGADEVVRIETFREECKVQAVASFEKRESCVDCAPRCTATGFVAVEAQCRLGTQAPQGGNLLGCKRGAEGGDGMCQTRLTERDHVHIAFNDEKLTGIVGCLAGAMRIEEQVTLMKDRCLG